MPIRRTTKVSPNVLSHVFERPYELKIRKALKALLTKHRLKRKYTIESTLGYLVEYYDEHPYNAPSYEELEKMTLLDLSAYYSS